MYLDWGHLMMPLRPCLICINKSAVVVDDDGFVYIEADWLWDGYITRGLDIECCMWVTMSLPACCLRAGAREFFSYWDISL